MNMVEIINLRKRFGDRELYSHVNLSFPKTGLYAIVGDSGSGKTSLLEIIGGIDSDYLGSVFVNGCNISEMDEEARSEFRFTNIGYIRQQYDLLELESVVFNVLLPLRSRSEEDRKTQLRKSKDLLKEAGLEGKTSQKSQTLSGGEKQRTALARSLALDPKIILADEPTGALDEENGERLFSLLSSLSKDRLVILVSHDMESVKRQADKIITLRNGKFEETWNDRQETKQHRPIAITTPPVEKKKSSLSLWLGHAANVLKAKKGRSLLSLTLLVFSLISFGTSIYMSSDINKEINGAFSALVGQNTLVMESKTRSDSQFGKIISAPESEVNKLMENYPTMFSSYGVSYLADLDSFFVDKREFGVMVDGYFHPVRGLSMKNVIDYSWIEEATSLSIYPSKPPELENDQIVLGLSYESMASLAYSLGTFRDYGALGNYLLNHEVNLIFSVENSSWGYSDEEMFRVMGIAKSENTAIYHYSHFWNRYVIEDKMRFHPSDESTMEKPWDFQQAYFVTPTNSYQFIQKLRSIKSLSSFVFEKTNHLYSPAQCPIGEPCGLDRYLIYLADKKTIAPSLIDEISGSEGIAGSIVGANGAYVSFPDAMMEGFSSRFFLSDSLAKVEEASDQISYLKEEQSDLQPVLEEGVKQGYYLLPKSSAVTLSNDFSSLMEGRYPNSLDEVCVSSALYSYYGSPRYLYCASMMEQSVNGGYLSRRYVFDKLRVVGVVEDSNDILYVDSYWAIDYFRERVGVSSFNLEPSSLTLFLSKSADSKAIKEKLSSKYQMNQFTDPSSAIEESVSSTMGFLRVALLFGSIGCLGLSLLLLSVMAMLTVLECDKEGRTLFLVGFSRKEIMDSYFASTLVLVFLATLVSLGGMVAVEFFSHIEVGSALGMQGGFNFAFVPLLAIIGAGIAGILISSLAIYLLVANKDFSNKGI